MIEWRHLLHTLIFIYVFKKLWKEADDYMVTDVI